MCLASRPDFGTAGIVTLHKQTKLMKSPVQISMGIGFEYRMSHWLRDFQLGYKEQFDERYCFVSSMLPQHQNYEEMSLLGTNQKLKMQE